MYPKEKERFKQHKITLDDRYKKKKQLGNLFFEIKKR